MAGSPALADKHPLGRENIQLGDSHPIALVFDVDTTIAGTSGVGFMTLPIIANAANDFKVDWGDGSAPQGPYTDADLPLTFDYSTDGLAPGPGTYAVSIGGTCPRFAFNNGGDRLKVTAITSIDFPGLGCIDASGMWYGCTNLIDAGSSFDTTRVTTLYRMFRSCSSIITPPDTSGWDTSLVTSLRETFQGCNSMEAPPDTSEWDTSKVLRLQATFLGCSKMTAPPDTRTWDTSSATHFIQAFQNCTNMASPPDTSDWVTSNVLSMAQMFENCNSIATAPITTTKAGGVWDTSQVTSFFAMFKDLWLITVPPDTSGWDTSNAIGCERMFWGCTSMITPPDTRNWNVAKVVSIDNMFLICGEMRTPPDTSLWVTTSLENIASAWERCTVMATPPDTSIWDVSKVTNFNAAWLSCNAMSGPMSLSPWILTAATQNENTFSGTNIDAASIDDWLIQLDTTGPAIGSLDYSPMVNDQHLDSARSPNGLAAVQSLIGKGWNRTGTYS